MASRRSRRRRSRRGSAARRREQRQQVVAFAYASGLAGCLWLGWRHPWLLAGGISVLVLVTVLAWQVARGLAHGLRGVWVVGGGPVAAKPAGAGGGSGRPSSPRPAARPPSGNGSRPRGGTVSGDKRIVEQVAAALDGMEWRSGMSLADCRKLARAALAEVRRAARDDMSVRVDAATVLRAALAGAGER